MKKIAVEDDPYGVKLEERKQNTARQTESKFNEEFHLKGRAGWICDLYLELDKFIMTLGPTVRKEYLQTYIKYSHNGVLFTYLLIGVREHMGVWAKVHYSSLKNPPLFVRDLEGSMHRAGVMVKFDDERDYLQVKLAMLQVTCEIIKKAFKWVSGKKRVTTPLHPVPEVVQEVKVFTPVEMKEITLAVGPDGFVEVKLRVHKHQVGKVLNDIMLNI